MKNIIIKFLIKLIALILIFGGLLGALFGIYAVFVGKVALGKNWIFGAMYFVAILAFIWSIGTGILLWKRRPFGVKSAVILFGTQIPIFALPGLTYGWNTGVLWSLIIEQGQPHFTLKLISSSSQILFDSQLTDVAYGVNIIALLEVLFLLMARSSNAINRSGWENSNGKNQQESRDNPRKIPEKVKVVFPMVGVLLVTYGFYVWLNLAYRRFPLDNSRPLADSAMRGSRSGILRPTFADLPYANQSAFQKLDLYGVIVFLVRISAVAF